MAVLVNPKTGQAFEVADDEAEGAAASMDLVPATPEQIDWLQKQREYEAKPLADKALETGQTYVEGLQQISRELGRLRHDDSGIARALFPEQAPAVQSAGEAFHARRDAMLAEPGVAERAERHPMAHSLGVDTPALFVSGGVGGLLGMAAESAAVGLSEEAVNRTTEGRDFDVENAAGIAAADLAFSGLAHAATQVAGHVGNLFMFGTGNTMARNVRRGLDETAGPVVPDDVRFEGPLLEAETRSRRAAAAASPGMPPGPERDELLRRSARDLEQQVESQGGEMFATTAEVAQRSASVTESEAVARRIDDFLTETTPAQTAWSADATQKLDEMRQALAMAGDVPPLAASAQEAADDAVRAIDGSGDSAEWFKAAAEARDRLDAIADDLPDGSTVSRTIGETRDFLARSLSDRALFGTAAEVDAGLRGAARDRIGAAARAVGGDLRAHLAAFVAADAAERAAMRGPLEQAIEGFEELAATHERFGTATPKAIESLRENAATLRRGIQLADDVRAAEAAAPPKPRARTEAAEQDFSHAESIADQIRKRAEDAAKKVGLSAAQRAIDYAAGPGRAVYDDAVSDTLKGAIQGAAAMGGLAVFGPAGAAVGWLGARKLGNRYAPKIGAAILETAQRYVKKHGADTAGVALLGTAALGDDESDDSTLAASVGGLLFAQRFARRALDATGAGVRAAGKGIYRASEAAAGAVDTVTGRATEALGRGAYKAGRAVGEGVGAGVDAVARAAADERRVKRVVGSATRDALRTVMGPLGWAGRQMRYEVGKSAADYLGPRISRRAIEWLERRARKTTAETVQDAVTETVEAARREPLLLPEHTEQAEAMATDFAEQLRRSGAETAEERAAALAAFPRRLGGDPNVQRKLLASSVQDLVSSLGKVSDASAEEAARAFSEFANKAILNARTVQDRFRIGMQLTQTLAEHTALAGDGEMAKVFGAHTEKMWEMMGQREIWMGSRELEREAKRQGKRRQLLLDQISSGEKLGIAAVGGAAALDDEDDGAAMAGAGMLAFLLGRKGLMGPRASAKVKAFAKNVVAPIGEKALRDADAANYLQRRAAQFGLSAKETEGVLSALRQAQALPFSASGVSSAARRVIDAGKPAESALDVAGVVTGRPLLAHGGNEGTDFASVPKALRNILEHGEVRPIPELGGEIHKVPPTDDFFARHAESLAHDGRFARRLTGPGGKSPGGFFQGKDGKIRYIKIDKDPAHTQVEVDNLRMYEALGVRAPKPELIELPDGQRAISTDRLEGWKELHQIDDWSSLPQSVRDSYARQAVIDVVMGNWDVTRNAHNVMTDRKSVLLIDAGEALSNAWQAGWFKEAGGNVPMLRDEIEALTATTRGGSPFERGGVVGKDAPANLLKGRSSDQLRAIMQNSLEETRAKIAEFGGPLGFIKKFQTSLSEDKAKRAAEEMQTRIEGVAKAIPVMAALVWLAFSGDADAAEPADPDERTKAANRILSIDDAATQRIRHTARVLSGLAEPPGPEGLTTALGRFGADYDDARAAFEERKAILQKAELAPALVYDVIGASLGDVARVSPELYQAAAARLLDGFRYMRENLPAEIKTSLLYPTGLPPSESAMRDWATQWNTVMDPESVLEDIERGTASHLQVRTLQGAHPDLYQQLRTEVIAEVGSNFASIPTATKMQLDLLFDADGLAGPMFSSRAATMIGEASRAASKRKQPGPVESGADEPNAPASSSGLEAIRSSVTNRSAA